MSENPQDSTWRGLEFKALRLELKDVDESGHFEGFAAVYGPIDRNADILEDGALEKTVQENPSVPILHMHNPFEPIGVADLTHVTKGRKRGLGFKGRLTLDVQRAREDHALMRDGAMGRMSIGYQAVKKKYEGAVRHLFEIAVKEVSPVTTGFEANPLATIDSVKTALNDEDKIRAAATLLKALREGDDLTGAADLLEEPEDSTLRDAIAEAKLAADVRALAEAIRKA